MDLFLLKLYYCPKFRAQFHHYHVIRCVTQLDIFGILNSNGSLFIDTRQTLQIHKMLYLLRQSASSMGVS